MERIGVSEYFKRPERLRPSELVWGMVREPPAPRYGHQSLLTHLGALLHVYVREQGLGQVCVAPVDVVLDPRRCLVVQPDIVFVRRDRLEIIRDRIWGPPDLVIEVLSPGTAHRDRTTKLRWYRRYGVRECWLITRHRREIEVFRLDVRPVEHTAIAGADRIRSSVLPDWNQRAADVFD